MHNGYTNRQSSRLYDYSTTGEACQGISQISLRNEVSDWLSGFPWEWWSTFTFRFDCSSYSAKNIFQKTWDKTGLDYFMAIEWHKWRKSVHIHALMGNTLGIRRLTQMDEWYKRYGIARIMPYNAKLGAKHYITKYIVKELADWDIRIGEQKYL